MAGKFTDNGKMTNIASLLKLAHSYAELEGVGLSTVSSRAFNDGKKLAAIEGGADIQVKRLEKTFLWFSENWPDSPWPDGIPRPASTTHSPPVSNENTLPTTHTPVCPAADINGGKSTVTPINTRTRKSSKL